MIGLFCLRQKTPNIKHHGHSIKNVKKTCKNARNANNGGNKAKQQHKQNNETTAETTRNNNTDKTAKQQHNNNSTTRRRHDHTNNMKATSETVSRTRWARRRSNQLDRCSRRFAADTCDSTTSVRAFNCARHVVSMAAPAGRGLPPSTRATRAGQGAQPDAAS